MTARTWRYVAVEYRGGPKDGDRDVMLWPPLREVRFPTHPALALHPDRRPGLEVPPLLCHCYALTDVQDPEPFEVSERELEAARDAQSVLRYLAASRRPVVYTWQGAA